MSSPFTPPEADQEIAPPSTLEILWINHRAALLGGIATLILIALIALGVFLLLKAFELDVTLGVGEAP
jgi:hypothetical protein